MQLREIYQPVEKELLEVEQILKASLQSSRYKSILEATSYLLDAKGKRLRPTLVLLSARASQGQSSVSHKSVTSIAAAVELIHMASLIHDDVIDRAHLRYNKPTVNSKWGSDTSIALGDYLYSVAFELISQCGNKQILECISSATRAMCEGELLQVCERDNLDLLKERYFVIVKKKTASLFVASCHIGTLVSNRPKRLQKALKGYGLNFGIAFQIIDDYLDLVGEEKITGKAPGQDIRVGEATLPLLNLWESVSSKNREELEMLLTKRKDRETLRDIRQLLSDSGAIDKTKEEIFSCIDLAKKNLEILPGSPYKDSLIDLADFVYKRGFDGRV